MRELRRSIIRGSWRVDGQFAADDSSSGGTELGTPENGSTQSDALLERIVSVHFS